MARRKARLAAVFLLLAAALPLVFFLSGTRLSTVGAASNDVRVAISDIFAYVDRWYGQKLVKERELRVQSYTISSQKIDDEEWTHRYTPAVTLSLGDWSVRKVKSREVAFADGTYVVEEWLVTGGISVTVNVHADPGRDETTDFKVALKFALAVETQGNITIAAVRSGDVVQVFYKSVFDHSGEPGWYEDCLGKMDLPANSKFTMWVPGKGDVSPRGRVEEVFAAYRNVIAWSPAFEVAGYCAHRSWYWDSVADVQVQDSQGTLELQIVVWTYRYMLDQGPAPGGPPGVEVARNQYTSGLWLAVQWFVYVLLAGVVLYILARVLPPLVSAITARRRWGK